MAIFTGSGVALVTPFHEDESINYDKLDEMLDYHCTHGTDSIIICGTTGESSTLLCQFNSKCFQFFCKLCCMCFCHLCQRHTQRTCLPSHQI